MDTNWKKFVVTPKESIRNTMEVIDKNSSQIALIVDDEYRLVGAVTDGDIRRAILKGIGLQEPVDKIMNKHPVSVLHDKPSEDIFLLMKQKGVKHVPVVDERGIIKEVHLIKDFLTTSIYENWVIIMAGGLGIRLAPLTNDCPKPMLKIGDKPILEIIVEGLRKQNFKNIFISVNYKSSQIKEYFGDGNGYGVTINYIDEEKALGTAGALNLLPEKPDIPFIVINGDLISNLNFTNILDFHEEHEGVMTVCVKEYDLKVPYGVINVDNHLINSIEEKPVYTFFVNSGIYCLDPVCVDFVPKNEFIDMTTLLKQIKENGKKVCAFPIVEYWLDVGRHSDFKKANTDFSNRDINR